MQGSSRLLPSDSLAKGMTRSTRILGVPFEFAINNVALFVLLMLVFYITTQRLICLFVAMGGMVLSHLVMMILSLKEEKALSIIASNFSLCQATPFSSAQSYTPLKSWLKKSKLKEHSSAKHIPWTHLYDEHTVMTKKGELIQVLTLDGMPFDTKDDHEVEHLKKVRNRLLYQMASPSVAISFYTIKRKHAPYPEGTYPMGYAHELNERYKRRINTTQRYQNALYIVLQFKAPALGLSPKKSKITDESIQSQREYHAKAIKTLNEHSARFMSLFKESNCRKLGTVHQHYTGSELLSFLSELVNLEQRLPRVPMQSLQSFLAHKSHHFAKRRGIVQLQGANGKSRYCAMLSLKEYPDETHACLMDALLEVPCELIITQSFLFKHNQLALKELRKQQRKMAQTDDSVLLAEALDLSIEELKSGRASYGEHHLSIAVIADDLTSLHEGIDALESKLNQDAGLITVREEEGIELAFWAQLPGNQAYRIRQSLISSLNIASFANLHNYPMGKAQGNHWGEAITILETLAGTSFHLNLHVGQVGNAIFIGPMGGGKTLLLAAILSFTVKYGGWRFIFDKDRGMEAIVRALGGSYHVIEPGVPSGMAPLQLEDTPENRAFNMLLLKRLLSTTNTLTAHEEQLIEKAVEGAYELSPEHRLYRHIAPFFGAAIPGSLRERFDRWHSQGQNSWLFDNEADSFSINNPITGQDIGKLLKPGFEELSIPALMYLFHRISDCLDSSPTLALIPEGWKALSDPLFQEQLKDWSRTPRKNNMAMIMDTQSPEELAASSAGSSVAREARTQVFFGNSMARWVDYQQFNLSIKEFEIIKEVLPALEGHYFLLKQGNTSVIARLNLTSLEQDIPVLSCTMARALLLDKIRERVGDSYEAWLPYYSRLSDILEKNYRNDFTRLEPNFERHWEQCQ
ncbi:VirB3 family type IV secretion system protein [Legionella lytica]|uniref:VirB3 family type IV secretion system protein n=1 Tax=Legionella lytica TaxID=96232 RepID=A0ABW8DB96_9GAMM